MDTTHASPYQDKAIRVHAHMEPGKLLPLLRMYGNSEKKTKIDGWVSVAMLATAAGALLSGAASLVAYALGGPVKPAATVTLAAVVVLMLAVYAAAPKEYAGPFHDECPGESRATAEITAGGDGPGRRGRPRVGDKVEIRMSDDLVRRIDGYAADMDLTRSEVIRRLVIEGLERNTG
jgi:hypothetical protein